MLSYHYRLLRSRLHALTHVWIPADVAPSEMFPLPAAVNASVRKMKARPVAGEKRGLVVVFAITFAWGMHLRSPEVHGSQPNLGPLGTMVLIAYSTMGRCSIFFLWRAKP